MYNRFRSSGRRSTRRSTACAGPRVRERGSAPKRGRHSTIFFPPNASVQWQLGGLTIHIKKWFLGAGFPGAPPISLIGGREPSWRGGGN